MEEQVLTCHTAHVAASLHLEVAAVSPVGTPRVAEEPIVLAILCAPTNNGDSMIMDVIRTSRIRINTRGIVIEGGDDFDRGLQGGGVEGIAAVSSDVRLHADFITIAAWFMPRIHKCSSLVAIIRASGIGSGSFVRMRGGGDEDAHVHGALHRTRHPSTSATIRIILLTATFNNNLLR